MTTNSQAVQQLLAAKTELENTIAAALNQFSHSTGLKVNDIHIDDMIHPVFGIGTKYTVDVTIRLETP